MAPEQLEGQEIDARADIFAFGSVLYEMVTGRKAFEGRSRASVTAAIMSAEPAPMSSLQPLTPSALDHIVKKCLVKDRDDRWQNAQDLTTELSWIAEGGSPAGIAAAGATRSRSWGKLAWTAGLPLLLLVTTVVLGVLYFRQTTPDQRMMKFTMSPPEKATFTFIAISPDGRRVAFTATDSAHKSQLWVRSLDAVAAQPLAGADGASNPFWSPDSGWIGFFADGRLKKIDASGGPPQVLANAMDNRGGGAWSRVGVIVFCAQPLGPLYQVPVTGGELKPVTQLDPSRQETAHRWPQFLPGGRRFLYHNDSQEPGQAGIYAASLDSKETVRLLASEANAAYAGPLAGPGHILFLRDRTLMAQPFDPEKLQTKGEAVPVAEQVGVGGRRAGFSVSSSGMLVYDSIVSNDELRWFDHSGKSLGTVGPPDLYVNLDLSPDDRRVAVDFHQDIWLFDLERNASYPTDGRLTAGSFSIVNYPMPRLGGTYGYCRSKESASPFPYCERSVTSTGAGSRPMGSGSLTCRTSPVGTRFSCERFRRVNGGGELPRWRADGKELFYLGPDRQMMMVSVKPGGAASASFEAAIPRVLFPTRAAPGNIRSYAVTSDGQRFLINQPAQDAASGLATVVVNWTAGLKK